MASEIGIIQLKYPGQTTRHQMGLFVAYDTPLTPTDLDRIAKTSLGSINEPVGSLEELAESVAAHLPLDLKPIGYGHEYHAKNGMASVNVPNEYYDALPELVQDAIEFKTNGDPSGDATLNYEQSKIILTTIILESTAVSGKASIPGSKVVRALRRVLHI